MTMTSRMIKINDLIRPELFELSALELEKNAIFYFVYTLTSVNKDQSAPNLGRICMIIRSRMSLILVAIAIEQLELFALDIVEFDFVYTLAYTNINKSAPNFATMYTSLGSRMSLIMDLIGLEW